MIELLVYLSVIVLFVACKLIHFTVTALWRTYRRKKEARDEKLAQYADPAWVRNYVLEKVGDAARRLPGDHPLRKEFRCVEGLAKGLPHYFRIFLPQEGSVPSGPADVTEVERVARENQKVLKERRQASNRLLQDIRQTVQRVPDAMQEAQLTGDTTYVRATQLVAGLLDRSEATIPRDYLGYTPEERGAARSSESDDEVLAREHARDVERRKLRVGQ